MGGASKLVSQGAGTHLMREEPEEQLASTAAQCRSILVSQGYCTHHSLGSELWSVDACVLVLLLLQILLQILLLQILLLILVLILLLILLQILLLILLLILLQILLLILLQILLLLTAVLLPL